VLDQNSKDDTRDARINAEAQNATATGFELKINTWNNTLIWSATASFIAYGDAEFPQTLPPFQSIMGSTSTYPPFATAVHNQYPQTSVPYSTTTTTTAPQNTTTTTTQTQTSTVQKKPPTTTTNNKKTKASNVSGSDSDTIDTPPKKKQKTSSNVSSQTKKGSDEDDECKVCMDAKINTVIIPCGHLCVCLECSKLLTNKTCPICKQVFHQIIKTFQT